MEKYLRVGVVTSAHGIKGEAKILPTTDDPARFKCLKKVLTDPDRGQPPLEIEGVKFYGKFVIAKFSGIDSREGIEKYKGKSLFVPRSDGAALKKDEYYIADLLGMKVTTDDGDTGVLKDVIFTGANEVYAVDFEKYGEVLIPAIRQCILDVDVERGTMRVHLLEGLV